MIKVLISDSCLMKKYIHNICWESYQYQICNVLIVNALGPDSMIFFKFGVQGAHDFITLQLAKSCNTCIRQWSILLLIKLIKMMSSDYLPLVASLFFYN